MGKTRRGHKERSKEQELRYENHKLRRENSSLRKQLARVDLDRYSYVKDIVEEHLADNTEEITTTQMLASMKNIWKCNECGDGYLEIILYGGPGGSNHYYRQCNCCSNRTKGQKYNEETVRGIVKISKEEDK